MKAWIVGAIAVLALPTGMDAQLVEVHAGVRVSDRVAIEVHYGSPRHQPGVFVPVPVPPHGASWHATARRYSKAYRRAMQGYQRELRKFDREHREAHRLGVPHTHVPGGIVYPSYGRERHHRGPYRSYR